MDPVDRWKRSLEDCIYSTIRRSRDIFSHIPPLSRLISNFTLVFSQPFHVQISQAAPIIALSTYGSLALIVAEPKLSTRLFPRHDLTNVLLLTSFTGTSIWLWQRPHILGTPPGRRFPWVFFGSSIYILGSILMWAIIRTTIGRRPLLCITLSLASGTALTYSGVDYFKYLDKDFEPLEYPPEIISDTEDEI